MKQTDQTLLEQMRITDFEVENRKKLLSFSENEAHLLRSCRREIADQIDFLVEEFYQLQTSVVEIALLIGDADTLTRLKLTQRRYILDLFSGEYDLEYVNNRLRIGLVHKRIGVEPKFYLSAIHSLNHLLCQAILRLKLVESDQQAIMEALDKLLLFDVTLVFETYIRSMVSEIETAKEKSEQYARSLEEKVRERTLLLEERARTDALTGLLNVRHLESIVTKMLRSAQRRSEYISAIYIDVNDFKKINDTDGHQRGDEILRIVGNAIKSSARLEDSCFRYGGDEFCVILANCREEQALEIFVERLKRKVKEDMANLSLSIGIVDTGPHEYVDASTLIRLADEKMYIEKQAHKRSLGIEYPTSR